MTRVTAVVVIAALWAALFGVAPSQATAQDNTPRRNYIAPKVAKLKIGDIVKAERPDGMKLQGVLVGKSDDTVTIDVYRQRAFRSPQLVGTETIALGDLRDIGKPLSGKQIALITTGVLLGACAIATTAAVSSADSRPAGPPSLENGTIAEPAVTMAPESPVD